MRLSFLICLFLIAGTGFSQQRIVVTGTVTEEPESSAQKEKRPIRDVKIYPENKEGIAVFSNRLGKYYITLDLKENETPVLVFKSMLHDIYKRPLKRSELRKNEDDTIRIDVVLNFYTLPTFEVSAAPDTVFGSRELSVSDFEFHGDENFILLAYEKKLDKSSKILYVNQYRDVLSEFTVPDVAKELYSDFSGRKYVVCEKRVYEINVRGDVLSLYPIEHDYFEKQIRPWVDTSESAAYFSNHVWYYPEFDYYTYRTGDSVFNKLHTVIDKPLMELYRAQYKYVDGRDKLEAYRAQRATGVDKEIWIAIWSGFPNSIYYNSLYAPMFVQNDTILIFDHYTNKLFRYNSRHEAIDSIDISYHIGPDKKQWEELLVKDSENQRIYAVYLKEGRYFLKELNTGSGEIKNVYRLSYKYPECLKIKDGYAYYIYRSYESTQKKFLYKEKIDR